MPTVTSTVSPTVIEESDRVRDAVGSGVAVGDGVYVGVNVGNCAKPQPQELLTTAVGFGVGLKCGSPATGGCLSACIFKKPTTSVGSTIGSGVPLISLSFRRCCITSAAKPATCGDERLVPFHLLSGYRRGLRTPFATWVATILDGSLSTPTISGLILPSVVGPLLLNVSNTSLFVPPLWDASAAPTVKAYLLLPGGAIVY